MRASDSPRLLLPTIRRWGAVFGILNLCVALYLPSLAGAVALGRSGERDSRSQTSETCDVGYSLQTVKKRVKVKKGKKTTYVTQEVTTCVRDSRAPSTPTGLAAAPGDATITLSWNASSDNVGVVGYRITRGDRTISTVTTTSFQDSGLRNGTSYKYSVVALDAAGNRSRAARVSATPRAAATPDTTAPSTPTNLQAAPGDMQVTLSWSASTDTGGSGLRGYECSINGGAYAACTSPKAYTGLTNGTAYSFSVLAVDNADNRSAPATTSATPTAPVDNTAPAAPTITAKPTSPTNSTSASFSWTGAEPGGTFECSLNGGAFATCASPQSYTGLTQGSRSFSVRQIDLAGNISPAASYTWTLDTTAPATPGGIQATPGDAQATLSWTTSADTGGAGLQGYECSINAGAYTACTSPKSYTGLTNGTPYSFAVVAVDNAGNRSVAATTSATPVAAPVDNTPPGAPTITAKPASLTNSTSASFSWTGAEPGGTFECSLDAGAYATCTSPRSYTGLTQGSHSFSVRQRDAATNVSTATAYSWTVDTTAPAAPTITAKPTSPTSSTSASFSFTGEAGASFECSLNAGAYAACTSPQNYTGLTQGSRSFSVRQTDAAGNVSAAASYTWTLDTTAPATPGSLSATAGDTRVDLSWTTSADTGGAGLQGYECSINAGAYAACTSPKAYTGLTNGTAYSFSVVAVDNAGNRSVAATKSATPAAVVDTTKPSTPAWGTTPIAECVSPVGGTKTAGICKDGGSHSIWLDWQDATDNVGVTKYRLHRAYSAICGPGACTAPANPTPTAPWPMIRETTAPTTVGQDCGGSDTTNSTTKLGAPYKASCSSTDNGTLPTNRTYYYYVEAVDAAGNVSLTSPIISTYVS